MCSIQELKIVRNLRFDLSIRFEEPSRQNFVSSYSWNKEHGLPSDKSRMLSNESKGT